MFLVSVGFRCSRFGNKKYIGYNDPFFYIYTVYVIIFVVMLFIADISRLHVKIRKILFLFTFLHQWIGRGMFIIFIGALLFDWHYIFECITSIVSIIVGISFIVYGCFFDKWRNTGEGDA